MDDFNSLNMLDKKDISYGACVAGATVLGIAVGGFVPVIGPIAGAVTGVALGLLTFRKISPAIEQILLSKNGKLTDQELLQVLRIVLDETGVRSKSEAMYLLSHARREMASKGKRLQSGNRSCLPIKVAAKKLLSQKA